MLVTGVLELQNVVVRPAAAGQRVMLDDSVSEPLREIVEIHFDGLSGKIKLIFPGHKLVGDRIGSGGGEGGEGVLELGSGGGSEEGAEEGVEDEDADDGGEGLLEERGFSRH